MEARADTLSAYYNGKLIFTSNGNWLHPLFELERYLDDHSYPAADIHVEDTIIGKAAAVLICRMGIKSLKVGTLSRLGEQVLKDENVDYTYNIMVDRVFCQTEDLLESIGDFDEAYALLCERAGL